MLIGTDGLYSFTFEHEKKADCPVCGGESVDFSISSELTVESLIEMLTERQSMYVSPPTSTVLLFAFLPLLTLCLFRSQIKKPSLSTPTTHIYFQAPPQLEAATRPNLEKKVSELVPNGGEVTVTAATLPFSLSLRISYH